jgi:hypothetical protein
MSVEARQRAIKVAGDSDIPELVTEDNQRVFDALVHVDFLPWRLVHERIRLHRTHQFRDALRDALDVLILSDEPLFPLCLVQARLIGVIEAEQIQEGKTIRNDRMVAVAVGSRLYAKVNELDDLPPTLMEEIEQFFINYNTMRGRVLKPTARGGAAEGLKLVKRSTAKIAKEKR